MKRRLVLLYTRDPNFDHILAQALSGTDTIVLVGRTVADGLKIVCRRGRELDLVVLDLNPGCRGMTLLSAIHGCYETLLILVVTSKESEPAKAIAGYAFIFVTNLTATIETLAIGQKTELSLLTPTEK